MNLPANRTLGVVIGAGFGATWGKSPTAFGWPGMGGQISFAEPATGISFAFFQMGDYLLEDMALLDKGLPPLRCRRAERETVALLRSRPVSVN